MQLLKQRRRPVSLAVTAAITTSFLASAAASAAQHAMETIEVHANNMGLQGLSLAQDNSAASRLGLSLIDIPASVSVLNRETINIRGDFSGNAAITRAPGFASGASPGNGGSAISARGFNGHGSAVHTYDGTRLYVGAGTVSFPADTWTVERVEVLRGPGSVINGVGAIGATVNYIPRKPSLEATTGEVAVTAGSFGLQRYAFGAGGPLIDNVAYRLDAVNHRSDGYVDRADEERTAIAGALLFQPREELQVQLSVDYADTDAATYWGTPLVGGGIPDAIRDNNYNVSDARVAYQDLWPRLHLAWHLSDSVQLRSDTYYLTARRHWRNVESYSYNPDSGLVDRSFYLEILHRQEQLGNRSDLLIDTAVGGMNNRFNIGFDINNIDFSHINNSPYEGTSSVDLLTPNPGTWGDGVASETTRDYDTDTLQYALFVDNVLELDKHWQIIAGARHDAIDYERVDQARSNGQEAGVVATDFSGTSWRLGAVFTPTETTSIYAQYSTAVDAIQSLLSASNPDLDLAEGKQVEIGIKQNLLEGRLQYTLSAFDIAKSDLISSDIGGVQRQIGEQSSRGLEFELFWLPLDTLSVDFNLALINPEYKEFVSDDADCSGNTPRRVPEETANLWLTWQLLTDWRIAAGARYVGERYLNDANTATLPDYTVYDASVQWQASEALRFSLRGKNLTDTGDYVLSPYGNQWVLGDGRSVEVGLHYGF